jgi:hypothetical protein
MRKVTILAVLVAALALPVSAGATIVVQKSIAGIGLRMTKAQVRAKLGRPAHVVNGVNDFGPYTNFVYRRVTVSFQGRQNVTGLRTTSRLERTAAGVGVGSSEARLKAAEPRARCKTSLAFRQCVVGVLKPGRVVTAFVLNGGKVSGVILGYVLD